MMIQLESPKADYVREARRDLYNLAVRWGLWIGDTPARRACGTIAPVAAVMMLIPSLTFLVLDPADRILKRRRAEELIELAQRHAKWQVTAWLIFLDPERTFEVHTLTPDQLLDLVAQDPYDVHEP